MILPRPVVVPCPSSSSWPRAKGAALSVPLVLSAVLGCAATAGARPARSAAEADAACPWGRLADGRGGLVRCLSEGEARRLMGAAPAPAAMAPEGARLAQDDSSGSARAPAGAAKAPPGPPSPRGTQPAASPQPPAAGAALAAPTLPAPPQATASPDPARGAPEPEVAPPLDPALTVEIGEPTADVGALPEAVRSLTKATDRFRECIQKHGGIGTDRGEVDLRFLVRGRGRAEGVNVKRWKGVTEAAARCVADVVDRRYVGYPEEPIVGATLTLIFSKKKR